jgi:hypothetical protein
MGTRTSREVDTQMVRRGLIVTEDLKIEKISADASSLSVSYTLPVKRDNLRIPVCACLSRWRPRQVHEQAGSGSIENHSFELEALDRLSDAGSWESE